MIVLWVATRLPVRFRCEFRFFYCSKTGSRLVLELTNRVSSNWSKTRLVFCCFAKVEIVLVAVRHSMLNEWQNRWFPPRPVKIKLETVRPPECERFPVQNRVKPPSERNYPVSRQLRMQPVVRMRRTLVIVQKLKHRIVRFFIHQHCLKHRTLLDDELDGAVDQARQCRVVWNHDSD